MSTEFYNRNWRMPKSSNSSKVSNYSMSFDSASNNWIELIDSSNIFNGLTAFSVSLWLNPSSTQVAFAGVFGYQTASTKYFKLYFNGTPANNQLEIAFRNSATAVATSSINSIPLNTWTNVIIVFDASSSLSLYVNGSLDGQDTTNLPTSAVQSTDIYIGTDAHNSFHNSRSFNGNLDHVAIFDYALSSSQVTSLYGNSTDGVGNPMELSTKPVAYYKIGDKAVFNGSEYLVTNAASEVYSPYALDFDGTNDYIDCANNFDFERTDSFSVSVWANFDANETSQVIGKQLNSYPYNGYAIQTRTNNKIRVILINTVGNRIIVDTAENSISTTGWFQVAFTYDGSSSASGVKIYINGSLATLTITENTLTSSIQSSANFSIASRDNAGVYFNGQLSNASVWNAALSSAQITEIYNQGKPSNLNTHSAYSNLVSWWQLGENMSYDGTNWTVLDEKGTNNGTSANMTEADLVNGVGTSANGISDSMGGADNIIGDAPYSTANAVSYGMGVDAKSTSVPS